MEDIYFQLLELICHHRQDSHFHYIICRRKYHYIQHNLQKFSLKLFLGCILNLLNKILFHISILTPLHSMKKDLTLLSINP